MEGCFTNDFRKKIEAYFDLAIDIRLRLANKTYLFDQYVSMLLEASTQTVLFSAAEQGRNASSELRGICRSILDDKNKSKSHPFYEHAREVIQNHPSNFQERMTKRVYYQALLFKDFIPYAVKEYADEQYDVVCCTHDILYLRELHDEISELLGESRTMKRLDSLYKKCFLMVTPVQVFMQEMVNEMLMGLNYRDIETSRLIEEYIF